MSRQIGAFISLGRVDLLMATERKPNMRSTASGQAAPAKWGAGHHMADRLVSRIILNTIPLYFWQVFRMCCVSLFVNGLGFAVYVWLTYSGLEPKLSATLCFAGGVLAGYSLNRSWTFRDPTYMHHTLPRYAIAYGIAYIVNMLGLYVFFDRIGYPHMIVQLALVIVISCALFLAQKFWIFSGKHGLTRYNQSVE